MGASQKGNNDNGQVLESKSSPDDDISLTKDYSVKFINCKCGALIDSGEPECWSCGHKFKKKGKNKPTNSIDTTESNIPKEDSKLESEVTFTNFISCPYCGSNNEIYSAETKCWFCSKTMDTKESWEQIVAASNVNLTQFDEKNTTKEKKVKDNSKSKIKHKKAIIKYVLHCSKCNSWFITNDFSPEMECNSCKSKNTLSISYTCEICNRFFDLNGVTKQDCPYCKKPLGFTKEEALY